MNTRTVLIRFIPVIVIPLILLWLDPPTGLSITAWHLFAVYIGAILGLVFQPFPEPVVLLLAISIASIFFTTTASALSGYSDGTTWLVFAAVLLSIAFVETGLGKRLAYHLIGALGRTTLGLGYAGMFLDYILAPGIPSNTARTAGITFPILRSIAVALDSHPGVSSRRLGAYLSFLAYAATSTTSYAFLTAFAPNLLVAKFAAEILQVQLDWLTWFKAALLPTGIMLLVTPWLLYKIYPPELTVLDNKIIAAERLAEMGPIRRSELVLLGLFAVAILGWMFGPMVNLNATAVAIATIALLLLLRVVTWDQIAAAKSAWTTLIWYGGIIGLANALNKEGFFKWLALAIKNCIDFTMFSPMAVLCLLLLASIAVRYLFASGGAYTLSMVPVFFAIGLAANVPVMPLVLVIACSLSYASLLTHYGSAPGPVLFGAGYVEQKTWWSIGTIFVVVHLLVNTVIAFPYWMMIGLW